MSSGQPPIFVILKKRKWDFLCNFLLNSLGTYFIGKFPRVGYLDFQLVTWKIPRSWFKDLNIFWCLTHSAALLLGGRELHRSLLPAVAEMSICPQPCQHQAFSRLAFYSLLMSKVYHGPVQVFMHMLGGYDYWVAWILAHHLFTILFFSIWIVYSEALSVISWCLCKNFLFCMRYLYMSQVLTRNRWHTELGSLQKV